MKIAIIESNHWHVPLYLDAIERSGAEVVGICDSTGQTEGQLAARFRCVSYRRQADLLAATAIDFAFVFGRHSDMPGLAEALIERGIPFLIEKPCGVSAAEVARLAAAAELRGLYVAVPFIFRLSDLGQILLAAHAEAADGVDHASFRFLAGPPQRYEQAGVPWMLDRAVSGGGPLMNVGIHFVDLFLALARHHVVAVSAEATSRINHLSIEDFISLRMRTETGQIGTLECGYTYPGDAARQRELTASVRSSVALSATFGDGVSVRAGNGARLAEQLYTARMEADDYYADVVVETLAGLREGRRPFAGLRDAARAVAVIEAAYASALAGGAPVRPLAGHDAEGWKRSAN